MGKEKDMEEDKRRRRRRRRKSGMGVVRCPGNQLGLRYFNFSSLRLENKAREGQSNREGERGNEGEEWRRRRKRQRWRVFEEPVASISPIGLLSYAGGNRTETEKNATTRFSPLARVNVLMC